MVRTALNPPAWSLSCELLFYAAFPVLYALIKRIRPERLWAWTAAVAAVAVIGVPAFAATVVRHDALIPGFGISVEQFWFILQFPPTRALEFVLGMLLARIVLTGGRLPALSAGGVLALTIAAYVVAPVFPAVFSVNAVMLVPIALLVARLAVTDSENRRTWFSGAVMVRLGDITFAFYLWHQLVLMYGDHWLGDNAYGTPVGIAVLVLLFAISTALAYLLFTFVENPIMRRWSRPRRRRPVLKAVAAAPPPEGLRRAS
jgi:peptidoglycan/LPS O-acetylase OafA/YrhL